MNLKLLLCISTTVLIGKCQAVSQIFYLEGYHQNTFHEVRLKNLTSTSSVKFKASKYDVPVSGNYGLTVVAPIVSKDHFLLVKMPRFELRRTTDGQCIDRITIRNSFHGGLIYTGCWSNISRSFEKGGIALAPENKIAVELELGITIAPLSVFEILFTFAEKCSYRSNGQFRCSDGYCIRQALQCDSETNCLDGSDELASKCVHVRPISAVTSRSRMTTNVGVPVGTIIFIVILIAVYSKYRRRNVQPAVTTIHSPSTHPVFVSPPRNVVNLNQAPNPPQLPNPYPPNSNQYPPQYPPTNYVPQPDQFGAQPQYNPAFVKDPPPYGRY